MSSRKLYISPYLLGQMSVVEQISNEDLFIESLKIEEINTYAITFDYLMQCGVDSFATSSIKDYNNFVSEKHEKRLYNFLKEKATNISESKVENALKSIEDIFQYYLPENYRRDEKYQEVWSIKTLLQDIMIASNTGTSLFRKVSSITQDLEKSKEVLPLELFHPIKYLINSICQDTIDLPNTKHYLGKEDFKRFEKVFKEKPFLDYKTAHSELDKEEVNKNTALSNIQKNSINLYRKHNGLINIKKSILTTLSITPKIVDVTFGKIPGTVADLASKLLSNLIDTNRRIVIYDYEPIYNEVFIERVINPMKIKIKEEREEEEKKKLE
mgnify:CR=1 FL=1